MKRKEGWALALSQYVADQADVPHEWGGADCCSFSGGGILAMTGENPYTEFMNDLGHPYTDEATGRAFMERQGGLARILARLFGRPHKEGTTGDLAYCNFPDGSAVGLHLGGCAVFRGEEGLVEVDLGKCKFFKVP